jgi:hypothetical protein
VPARISHGERREGALSAIATGSPNGSNFAVTTGFHCHPSIPLNLVKEGDESNGSKICFAHRSRMHSSTAREGKAKFAFLPAFVHLRKAAKAAYLMRHDPACRRYLRSLGNTAKRPA